MGKCMACGKTVLLGTNFGNVALCKSCGSLLNVSAWSAREFSSVDELRRLKDDALQRAVANNIPQNIVGEITRYFDEYSNSGFITAINGRAGQTLKVFENYCIVTTKSESMKTMLKNMFHQFDSNDGDEPEDILISTEDKKNLVRGLMSGRLVQTGIGVAVSATLNKQEREKEIERKARQRENSMERMITVGEKRIELHCISGVESFSRLNTMNGYLKFVPKGVSSNDLYACEYFFFSNSIPFESKKIKQKVESVKAMINKRIGDMEQELRVAKLQAEEAKRNQQVQMQQMMAQFTQKSMQQSDTDMFEKVRKFKQLLDEGIITEEEFNAKKKELLGL